MERIKKILKGREKRERENKEIKYSFLFFWKEASYRFFFGNLCTNSSKYQTKQQQNQNKKRGAKKKDRNFNKRNNWKTIF